MEEAIVGIIGGIIMTIAFFATIAFYLFLGYKKKSLQSQQILAAIEKGADVSSLKFEEEKPNYMRRGLLLLFFGIALFIALWVQVELKVGIWGLLFIGLGIAYILVEKFDNQTDKEN